MNHKLQIGCYLEQSYASLDKSRASPYGTLDAVLHGTRLRVSNAGLSYPIFR